MEIVLAVTIQLTQRLLFLHEAMTRSAPAYHLPCLYIIF